MQMNKKSKVFLSSIKDYRKLETKNKTIDSGVKIFEIIEEIWLWITSDNIVSMLFWGCLNGTEVT